MKIARYLMLSAVGILALVFTFVSLITSGINASTTYKESDYFSYYSLTDGDIENAPRISTDYYFEYYPGDGYSPSNTIIFCNTRDVQPLREYLQRLGYKQQARHTNVNEIWISKERNDEFHLTHDPSRNEVSLTKILSR